MASAQGGGGGRNRETTTLGQPKRTNKIIILLYTAKIGSPKLPSYVKMAGNFVPRGFFSVGKLRTHLKFGVRSGIKNLVFYHSKELEFRHIINKNIID